MGTLSGLTASPSRVPACPPRTTSPRTNSKRAIHVSPGRDGSNSHLIPSARMQARPHRQAPVGHTNLMQFWDAPHAPDDVEELMASWSADPSFVYHRYSWESAHAFIQDRFDRRTLAVFESCAIPAMQSDVFRLCWLFEEGGVYVDSDQGNRGRNASFTDRTVRGHLFRRPPRPQPRDGAARTALFRNPPIVICNGLMSFFDRHDPLVGRVLDRVSANVERRIRGGVWRVTGPGVISTLLLELGPDHELFDNVCIHGIGELERAILGVRCDYKSSPRHWLNVTGSIYSSPT
jgi:Glycosyltransferase sugar-binding region containing DXD motif